MGRDPVVNPGLAQIVGRRISGVDHGHREGEAPQAALTGPA
jgi:hypothetical protein